MIDIDREELERMYTVERKSANMIAKELGYGETTIFRCLKRHGIPIRDSKSCKTNQERSDITPDVVKRMYVDEQKSAQEIARLLQCSRWVVEQRLASIGVPIRNRSQALCAKWRNTGHHARTHGRYVGQSLYRSYVKPDSRCSICGKRKRVAVHHINGDHCDNRPENLQIVCGSCHGVIHQTNQNHPRDGITGRFLKRRTHPA